MKWFRAIRNWVTLTPLRIAAAGALAVALLGTAGFGIHRWMRDRHYCATGVVYIAGQCIGVTDGGFVFGGPGSPLVTVEGAIHRQNLLIGNQPHVTIALLLPLTDPDPVVQTEILHEVQGAYAAQLGADSPRASNNAPLKIKLDLANPGVNSIHWKPVVRQLAGMRAAPDNLRAVFGISVSMPQTEAEVAKLTNAYKIAVVTGAPTANSFTNQAVGHQAFPGLARVSPTDKVEAAAITAFAGASRKQSVLVEDDRQGDRADDYITSLSSSYLPDTTESPYDFTSPQNEFKPGRVQSAFVRIVGEICTEQDIKWIYFAGRQVQLRIFLNQLEIAHGHECAGRNFTVITGDAAAHLVNDTQLIPSDFTSGGVTLDYPAIASPQAWTKGASPAAGGPAGQAMQALLGRHPVGRVDLGDGEAIINYDAALTAITEIRLTYAKKIPTPAQVGQGWSRLSVPGASGTICLSADGNNWDKAIDIMQMTADFSGFKKTVWPGPKGAPLGNKCEPLRGN